MIQRKYMNIVIPFLLLSSFKSFSQSIDTLFVKCYSSKKQIITYGTIEIVELGKVYFADTLDFVKIPVDSTILKQKYITVKATGTFHLPNEKKVHINSQQQKRQQLCLKLKYFPKK